MHTRAVRAKATSANMEVEMTEVVTVKGGRIAVNAIFLEMVAGTERHRTSKKSNYQLATS